MEEVDEKRVAAVEKAIASYEKDMLKQSVKEEVLRELGLEKKKKTMTNGNGHYESKIVIERELTRFLDQGWEFIASLNNEKYLVRRGLDLREMVLSLTGRRSKRVVEPPQELSCQSRNNRGISGARYANIR